MADGGLVGGTHAQSVDSRRAAVTARACAQLDPGAARLHSGTLAPRRVVAPR